MSARASFGTTFDSCSLPTYNTTLVVVVVVVVEDNRIVVWEVGMILARPKLSVFAVMEQQRIACAG